MVCASRNQRQGDTDSDLARPVAGNADHHPGEETPPEWDDGIAVAIEAAVLLLPKQ